MNSSVPGMRLCGLSVIWVLLGGTLAMLAPRWAFVPAQDVLVWIPIGLSMALIVLNAGASLRILARTGSALATLPLTLVQLFLFTLLFYQIGSHLGVEHYELESAPQWWHWLQFTAVHTFRAADLLDTLQAYGWQMQAIRAASVLTAGCVIGLHLMVSIFVVGFLVIGAGSLFRWWRAELEQRGVEIWRVFGIVAMLWLLVWIVSVGYLRPWNRVDITWWWIDNFLRVIDFPDLMEAFQVRLHQIPTGKWEGTLALVLRLIIVVLVSNLIARWTPRFRLRYLGGLGLTHDQLRAMERIRSRQSEAIRVAARKRLRTITENAVPARRVLRRVLILLSVVCVGEFLIGLITLPMRERGTIHLLRNATDSDSREAALALAAIQRLGPEAEEVIAPLAEYAWSADSDRPRAIWTTLGFMGPNALTPLSEGLRGEDEQESLVALNALEQVGPRAAPELVQAITSPHPQVRQAAERSLTSLGTRAVQPLLDFATEETAVLHLEWVVRLERNWHLRSTDNPSAASLLDQLRSNADEHASISSWFSKSKSTHELIEELGHATDPQLRTAAALELGDRPTSGQVIVPALIEGLNDKHSEVQFAVIEALKDLGSEAALAIPALIEFAETGNREGRLTALETIVWIGPPPPDTIAPLIASLADEDDGIRGAARQALRRGGTPVVPLLIECLDDSDPMVREGIGWVLGEIWPVTQETMPALQRLLDDDQPADRASAASALGTIGETAIPTLIQSLQSRYPDVRQLGAKQLGRIGFPAEEAIPALIQCLEDREGIVRGEAAFALSQMGPAARVAIPPIIPLLADQDTDVRRWAANAVGNFGPAAREATPLLLELLQDESATVRASASKALGLIGPPTDPIVAALTGLLQDEDPSVRYWVVWTLAQFGPAAEESIPDLIRLRNDPDLSIRLEVHSALQRIDPTRKYR